MCVCVCVCGGGGGGGGACAAHLTADVDFEAFNSSQLDDELNQKLLK